MENAKKSAVKKILVCAMALAMALAMATGAGGSIGQFIGTNTVVNAGSVGEGLGGRAFEETNIPSLSEVLDELSNAPEDYTYETRADGNIKIVSYNGTEQKIDIPSQIDDKTVTEIGDEAFKDKELTLVNIPDSIEYIGNEAFCEDSRKLIILNLPKNLKKVGNGAFTHALMRVDVFRFEEMKNLEEIGNRAFIDVSCSEFPDWKNGENYMEFIFPKSLKKIGDEAFAYTLFKKVTFNDGLEYIGNQAFYSSWKKQDAEINFSKSVKYIGAGAFSSYMGNVEKISVTFRYYSGGFMEDYLTNMASVYNDPSDTFNYYVKLEELGKIDEEPSQQEMNYGISVKGAYPEGAVLNAVATTTKWLEDPLFCFNITLQKDGEEVQPNGYITVSIPCSVEGGRVYYIDEETGEMEFLNAIYVDGEYKFVTDHLSEYCIKFADGTDISNALSKPEQKPDNNNSDNNTDDTSNNNSSNTNTENTDNNNNTNTNSNNNTNTNNNANNTSNSNTTDNSKSNSVVVPATGDNSAFTFGALIMAVISAATVFISKRRKSL